MNMIEKEASNYEKEFAIDWRCSRIESILIVNDKCQFKFWRKDEANCGSIITKKFEKVLLLPI